MGRMGLLRRWRGVLKALWMWNVLRLGVVGRILIRYWWDILQEGWRLVLAVRNGKVWISCQALSSMLVFSFLPTQECRKSELRVCEAI